jgi:ABC-type molybdate transport system substrate-binding protein
MKKIFIAYTLATISFTAMAFTTFKNGKVIMLVTVEVKNFTEWKKGFDAGAPIREKAGIKVITVGSAVDNENYITVIEEAENAQVANDFLNMLKEKQKSGELLKMAVKIYDKVE